MKENKKQKILLVGQNAYLASGLTFDGNNFDVTSIKRPFENSDKNNYKNYDYVINFCIQSEHFTRKLDETEMIDVKIAKELSNTNTKQIFLSSRKVYGSNTKLKVYKETDDLKPYDFYSENKVVIEQKLQEINSENLIILRTGNIIGNPALKKNYKTFVGWLEKELEKNGKVYCTFLPETKKDFITRNYFQEVLAAVINHNTCGIYNVGAGFALTIKEILCYLLPENLVNFDSALNESEQFILQNEKIKTFVREFTKEELIKKCQDICKQNFIKKI